ncbi:hypothetical protein O59_001268 [Cellvibrio sp. BR]|nr:hypothetical protein O59_001268 [Cellvibrio sp. BR]
MRRYTYTGKTGVTYLLNKVAKRNWGYDVISTRYLKEPYYESRHIQYQTL